MQNPVFQVFPLAHPAPASSHPPRATLRNPPRRPTGPQKEDKGVKKSEKYAPFLVRHARPREEGGAAAIWRRAAQASIQGEGVPLNAFRGPLAFGPHYGPLACSISPFDSLVLFTGSFLICLWRLRPATKAKRVLRWLFLFILLLLSSMFFPRLWSLIISTFPIFFFQGCFQDCLGAFLLISLLSGLQYLSIYCQIVALGSVSFSHYRLILYFLSYCIYLSMCFSMSFSYSNSLLTPSIFIHNHDSNILIYRISFKSYLSHCVVPYY